MQDDPVGFLGSSETNAAETRVNRVVLYGAVAWGILNGILTLALARFIWIAVNPITSILILPGIVVSMFLVGNVVAYWLGLAAVVNTLVHFGASWLLLRVLAVLIKLGWRL